MLAGRRKLADGVPILGNEGHTGDESLMRMVRKRSDSGLRQRTDCERLGNGMRCRNSLELPVVDRFALFFRLLQY